jgi:hypothetical protein
VVTEVACGKIIFQSLLLNARFSTAVLAILDFETSPTGLHFFGYKGSYLQGAYWLSAAGAIPAPGGRVKAQKSIDFSWADRNNSAVGGVH